MARFDPEPARHRRKGRVLTTTSVDIRARILDAFRRDLIGPLPERVCPSDADLQRERLSDSVNDRPPADDAAGMEAGGVEEAEILVSEGAAKARAEPPATRIHQMHQAQHVAYAFQARLELICGRGFCAQPDLSGVNAPDLRSPSCRSALSRRLRLRRRTKRGGRLQPRDARLDRSAANRRGRAGRAQ
jgi:hypothetical protein